MDAQSNPSPSVLNADKRERSRLVQKIDPAFPGVRGLRDLWRGWRDYRELWLTVGLYDIRKRYRRSLLGPFWITVSLGAFILGLSFIYVPLVGGDMKASCPSSPSAYRLAIHLAAPDGWLQCVYRQRTYHSAAQSAA